MVASEVRPMLRSIAHHIPGQSSELPVEGRLASFERATAWLNSPPLSPDALRGRVVLVDFWTYTCVNWLRTLPYVRAWAHKYRDAGLTVVGVHTPEFSFEHNLDNVRKSLDWFGVDWPVAQDNDYGVWRDFENHYWPAIYLADRDGRIRFKHFGEGEYEMTEMAIQQLLADSPTAQFERDLVMVAPRGLEVPADWRYVQSGETYLGYQQATGYVEEPRPLGLNEWSLTGDWTVGPSAALLNTPAGRIAFRFHARDVNLVMGPAAGGGSVPFRVFLDGQPPTGATGADVDSAGRGTASEQRTYQLLRQTGSIDDRTFEIEFDDRNVEAYCFTFG
jgi:thiol-disulfide isomerase/thioredoxin